MTTRNESIGPKYAINDEFSHSLGQKQPLADG